MTMASRRDAIKHDPPVPPPDRQRLVLLFCSIAAPPLAWTIQLLLLSALANYACFPADMPRQAPVVEMGWLPALEMAVDAIALVIALASAIAPYRYLMIADAALATGQQKKAVATWYWDRTCFLSLAGVFSACGFAAAVIFESVASIQVPPCG